MCGVEFQNLNPLNQVDRVEISGAELEVCVPTRSKGTAERGNERNYNFSPTRVQARVWREQYLNRL